MNVFLIFVGLTLIGFTILGGFKGFVHTIFTMFSLFLIILLTGILSPHVADYINNHTEIPKRIHSKVEEKINLKEKIKSGMATKRDDLIDSINAPEQLKNLLKEKSEKAGVDRSATTESDSKSLIDSIYDRITELIVNAIAYLFTFAVVGVIVIITGLLLDVVAKLPGIKQANTILGAVIGLLQGYMVVSLIYVLATAFGATAFGSGIIGMVAESDILSWFYEHNIVVDIVFGMFK